MAIAHTAIRNFAAASVVIAVVGFGAVLCQPTGGATAKAIKKDVELQKLLRGPQGPQGLPGSTMTVPSSCSDKVEQKQHPKAINPKPKPGKE